MSPRDRTIDVGPVHTLEPCDCGGTLHPSAMRLSPPRHHYRCTEDCPHPDHRKDAT